MKVIQVNCVYSIGSTGKIVADIHHYLLEQDISSICCYGRGAMNYDDNVIKVSTEWEAKWHSFLTQMTGVDFAYSFLATKKLISIIQKEKPDVVHLHCLNGHFVNVYKLLDYLKMHHIKTILTLHAEIMHTAGCEHAMECDKWKTECSHCAKIQGKLTRFFRDDAAYCFRLMKKSFSGFDHLTVIGVSDWLTRRAMESAVFSDFNGEFLTIKNGLDTNVFYPRFETDLKEKYARDNRPIILHVTPNFLQPIKGGKFVIEVAERHPEWRMIIVGFNGNIRGLPSNVIAVSRTNNQEELAKYYTLADVTLLTSKRETFSMVCAESLCCGTPVVGFKAGGPESVAMDDASEFVPYAAIDQLISAIEHFLNQKCKVNVSKAHEIYASGNMAEKYMSVYQK